MQISVIICTHNPREIHLRRTLDALRGQTLPVDQWELLLIDNASTVPVAGSVDLAWHPGSRVSREDKLGKMHAWFKGIGDARGDILVFVDDDNVLAPDYLEHTLVVAGEWPFIGAWGASIVPEFESTPPPWTKSQTWRLSLDEVKEDVWSNLKDGFETKPLGAGMCVRKEVGHAYLDWCRKNEMSNALDRKGNLITGYGDMNLALCAIDIGLGTGKSSRLRLTHLIPSTRLTLDYFLRHAEGDAMSLMMFRAIRGLPLKDPRQTLSKKLRWHLYKMVSGQPAEVFKIQDAYQKGAERGYQMALDYLKKKRPGSTTHES